MESPEILLQGDIFDVLCCSGWKTMAGSNLTTELTSQPGSSFSGETGTKKKCLKRGYTCCVPGCYSNTKRDKVLSFHMQVYTV